MLSLGGVHDSTSAGPVGFHSVNSGGMTSALIGMVGGGLLILLVSGGWTIIGAHGM